MRSRTDRTGKPRGRPFAKGNPGRKRGSRNKSTLVAEALLQGEMEGLVRAAIKLAKSGDGPMLKFFLGRRIAKDRPIQLDLPEINTPEDVVQALNVIARAVSEGEITPTEGAALFSMVESLSRTTAWKEEVKELNRKLKDVQQKLERERIRQLEDAVPKSDAITLEKLLSDYYFRLAALLRYGDPKMEEPLSRAWQRCVDAIENDELELQKKRWPQHSHETLVLELLKSKIRWEGAVPVDMRERFRQLFATAPLWLLVFTQADLVMAALELPWPEASFPLPGRDAFKGAPLWPHLPHSAYLAGGAMSVGEFALHEAERFDAIVQAAPDENGRGLTYLIRGPRHPGANEDAAD
jgi:hypothetical protein